MGCECNFMLTSMCEQLVLCLWSCITPFISLCASVFVQFVCETGNHDHPPRCIVGKCVAWNLVAKGCCYDIKDLRQI